MSPTPAGLSILGLQISGSHLSDKQTICSLISRPFNAAAAAAAHGGAAALPDIRRSKSFSCGRGATRWPPSSPAPAERTTRSGGPAMCAGAARSGRHQDDRERVRDGTAFGAFTASSSAAVAALAAEVLPPPQPSRKRAAGCRRARRSLAGPPVDSGILEVRRAPLNLLLHFPLRAADGDLAAARVVVDTEGKGAGGVVDTAVSLEMHLADYYSEISSSDLVRPWSNGGMEMLNRNRTQ